MMKAGLRVTRQQEPGCKHQSEWLLVPEEPGHPEVPLRRPRIVFPGETKEQQGQAPSLVFEGCLFSSSQPTQKPFPFHR